MERKKIIFVHLFNNYSGSPNVLAGVVKYFYHAGHHVSLLTSFNNQGFLTEVECDRKINITYQFVSKPFLLMLRFLRFQILAALKILLLKGHHTVYLNTIQPFMPAIAARIRGFRVVYHVHEAYPARNRMNRFLFFVLNHTADQLICVSNYVKEFSHFKNPDRALVLYNSLSEDFKNEADLTIGKSFKYRSNSSVDLNVDNKRKVLMVSSSRPYKGIFAFCDLAIQLPEFSFVLVCDTSEEQVRNLFKSYNSVENLKIHSTQSNLHPFYEMAHLIVNLTDPQLIVETFGLTILEGMYYGLPAIVPPVGGITELVEDGHNGYRVDMHDTSQLTARIREILCNESYHLFSNATFEKYKELENLTKMDELSGIV